MLAEDPPSAHARGRGRARSEVLRRPYDWILRWADHPSGPLVLVLMAVLEACVFPAPTEAMFIALVFANLWLTRPLVIGELEDNATTNAMVRTTTAVTMFQAGTKENVLASSVRAVVNFRILPGDGIAGVVEYVRRVVDDPRVEVRRTGRFSAEPTAVSSTDTESYRTLERTIRSVDPEAIVAPYLVVVGPTRATTRRSAGTSSGSCQRGWTRGTSSASTARMSDSRCATTSGPSGSTGS